MRIVPVTDSTPECTRWQSYESTSHSARSSYAASSASPRSLVELVTLLCGIKPNSGP
jgi:hypothetical protein